MSMLVSAMIAGAASYGPHAAKVIGEIGATEVVKEVTKEAYKALRERLIEICGLRAGRAMEKVEADPASSEAKSELAVQIGDIPEEYAADVKEKLDALLAALGTDDVARRLAGGVSIDIEVDAVGHVTIDTVKGAESFAVKAKAGGNFTFQNVEMDGGKSPGN